MQIHPSEVRKLSTGSLCLWDPKHQLLAHSNINTGSLCLWDPQALIACPFKHQHLHPAAAAYPFWRRSRAGALDPRRRITNRASGSFMGCGVTIDADTRCAFGRFAIQIVTTSLSKSSKSSKSSTTTADPRTILRFRIKIHTGISIIVSSMSAKLRRRSCIILVVRMERFFRREESYICTSITHS